MSDDLRDAIADVLPWGRTMSVERLADAILALPEMQARERVIERLRHDARDCGPDEEMNHDEIVEQRYARMVLRLAGLALDALEAKP